MDYCKICGELKQLKSKRSQTCQKCYQKQWYQANRDRCLKQGAAYYRKNADTKKKKSREHYIADPERHKENIRQWRKANLDRFLQYERKYRKKNQKKIKAIIKQWQNNNYERWRTQANKHRKKRRITDINFRIACNLRSRLGSAIKRNTKTGSAIKDLGCSIEDFKKHLEYQFDNKMNWDNYGLNGWEIDHIEPLNNFDLTNPEELKKACHYSNLRPLWASINRSRR